MPALPDVPGLLRVTFQGTLGTLTWANVMHVGYDLADTITQADADAMANSAHGAYNNRIMPQLHSSVTLGQVTVVDLSSTSGVSAINTDGGGGGQAASVSPLSVAFLVNWKIARRYRGGHARSYLPGVSEADVDGSGIILGTRRTALNTALGQFIADIAATAGGPTNPHLAVVHYFKDGVLQSSPTVDPIVSGSCNIICGTQRRRLRA